MAAPSVATPFLRSQTVKPGLLPAATARQQELVPPPSPCEAKANNREVRVKRVTVFITLPSIEILTRTKTSTPMPTARIARRRTRHSHSMIPHISRRVWIFRQSDQLRAARGLD